MLNCSIPKWGLVIEQEEMREKLCLLCVERQNIGMMLAFFFPCCSCPCKSVDGLIDDFITKSSSRYKAAYVYFTDCK